MVSSHMPKTAPPRENTVIVTGIKRTRRALLRPKRQAMLWMTTVIAPVFWMTENAPPTMRRIPMIAAASMNPRAGETKSPPKPWGRLSIRW